MNKLQFVAGSMGDKAMFWVIRAVVDLLDLQ